MLKLLLRKRSGSGESGLRFGCACMDVCALKSRGQRVSGGRREGEEGREEKEKSELTFLSEKEARL